MEIPSDPTSVAGDTVVAIVATQHRGEVSMLLADRLMPIALTPLGHCRQGAGEPSLCRHLPHHVLALQRPAPQVSKAKEVKLGTACRRMVLTIRTMEAEVDEPRLLRVEGESEPVQSLTQNMEDSLGIEMVLERHHQVIRIPDQ